jgi:hypothetical protein
MNSINTILFFIAGCVLCVGLSFGLNYLAINYEKGKIRKYAEERGVNILSISFRLVFTTDNLQRFEVEYQDQKGSLRKCTCKTGMFSRVFWDV